jgi:tRNA/tmRNA/rRNA uracil-C5-methylase (TrmA/RlmC/RlmD family)
VLLKNWILKKREKHKIEFILLTSNQEGLSVSKITKQINNLIVFDENIKIYSNEKEILFNILLSNKNKIVLKNNVFDFDKENYTNFMINNNENINGRNISKIYFKNRIF